MKKVGIPLYLILAYILFISSCSPTIQFNLKGIPEKQKTIFLQTVEDKRPVNEKRGYKIFYVDSISDEDYTSGFTSEFQKGLAAGLEEYFIVVDDKNSADIVLHATVNHFYGEYSQTVKTVFWEYGTALLLFIPRIITDAIPYNSFAGQVDFVLSFSFKSKPALNKEIKQKVTDSIMTYRRGSASTASRLSQAASPQLSSILGEVAHEI